MSLPTLFASLPLPAAMRPTALVVRALNAVLSREPWAQQRLAQYAGRTLKCTFGALPLSLSFTHAGQLNLTDSAVVADVELRIPTTHLSQLPAAFASSDPDAVLALVHIQGDAGLANAVAQVVSQLRFDPEAEIARFTGDLLAVRIVASLKHLMTSGQRTAQQLEGNVAEFLGEESGVLVSRDYLVIWQDQLQYLDQKLALLEQRTSQLNVQQKG
ncbi:hypothetical protein PAEH1_10175 [Paenalcaligenes hominis]|uniref:Ubiquinone biosynthesis accessory factor UbiJ n=1 Tax=Paenalcaligenes hominis TaxID=643674 RepID=A0A1U9K188_9BURK|nr:SCP2 sterol-binding domain-containing protein [Paenalcaligenes hominis]AQS51823.1 hypothetical protein PAEH1_10175 [Paenalcaligenes hominis]